MTATQTEQTATRQAGRYIHHKPATAGRIERSSQFGRSIESLLALIYGGLARNNATVEDISIRQNQVVVKYHTPNSDKADSRETLFDDKAVEISNVDVYSLDNGKVIERFNPVYQIRTSVNN